jgi:hypothetical protein
MHRFPLIYLIGRAQVWVLAFSLAVSLERAYNPHEPRERVPAWIPPTV